MEVSLSMMGRVRKNSAYCLMAALIMPAFFIFADAEAEGRVQREDDKNNFDWESAAKDDVFSGGARETAERLHAVPHYLRRARRRAVSHAGAPGRGRAPPHNKREIKSTATAADVGVATAAGGGGAAQDSNIPPSASATVSGAAAAPPGDRMMPTLAPAAPPARQMGTTDASGAISIGSHEQQESLPHPGVAALHAQNRMLRMDDASYLHELQSIRDDAEQEASGRGLLDSMQRVQRIAGAVSDRAAQIIDRYGVHADPDDFLGGAGDHDFGLGGEDGWYNDNYWPYVNETAGSDQGGGTHLLVNGTLQIPPNATCSDIVNILQDKDAVQIVCAENDTNSTNATTTTTTSTTAITSSTSTSTTTTTTGSSTSTTTTGSSTSTTTTGSSTSTTTTTITSSTTETSTTTASSATSASASLLDIGQVDVASPARRTNSQRDAGSTSKLQQTTKRDSELAGHDSSTAASQLRQVHVQFEVPPHKLAGKGKPGSKLDGESEEATALHQIARHLQESGIHVVSLRHELQEKEGLLLFRKSIRIPEKDQVDDALAPMYHISTTSTTSTTAEATTSTTTTSTSTTPTSTTTTSTTTIADDASSTASPTNTNSSYEDLVSSAILDEGGDAGDAFFEGGSYAARGPGPPLPLKGESYAYAGEAEEPKQMPDQDDAGATQNASLIVHEERTGHRVEGLHHNDDDDDDEDDDNATATAETINTTAAGDDLLSAANTQDANTVEGSSTITDPSTLPHDLPTVAAQQAANVPGVNVIAGTTKTTTSTPPNDLLTVGESDQHAGIAHEGGPGTGAHANDSGNATLLDEAEAEDEDSDSGGLYAEIKGDGDKDDDDGEDHDASSAGEGVDDDAEVIEDESTVESSIADSLGADDDSDSLHLMKRKQEKVKHLHQRALSWASATEKQKDTNAGESVSVEKPVKAGTKLSGSPVAAFVQRSVPNEQRETKKQRSNANPSPNYDPVALPVALEADWRNRVHALASKTRLHQHGQHGLPSSMLDLGPRATNHAAGASRESGYVENGRGSYEHQKQNYEDDDHDQVREQEDAHEDVEHFRRPPQGGWHRQWVRGRDAAERLAHPDYLEDAAGGDEEEGSFRLGDEHYLSHPAYEYIPLPRETPPRMWSPLEEDELQGTGEERTEGHNFRGGHVDREGQDEDSESSESSLHEGAAKTAMQRPVRRRSFKSGAGRKPTVGVGGRSQDAGGGELQEDRNNADGRGGDVSPRILQMHLDAKALAAMTDDCLQRLADVSPQPKAGAGSIQAGSGTPDATAAASSLVSSLPSSSSSASADDVPDRRGAGGRVSGSADEYASLGPVPQSQTVPPQMQRGQQQTSAAAGTTRRDPSRFISRTSSEPGAVHPQQLSRAQRAAQRRARLARGGQHDLARASTSEQQNQSKGAGAAAQPRGGDPHANAANSFLEEQTQEAPPEDPDLRVVPPHHGSLDDLVADLERREQEDLYGGDPPPPPLPPSTYDDYLAPPLPGYDDRSFEQGDGLLAGEQQVQGPPEEPPQFDGSPGWDSYGEDDNQLFAQQGPTLPSAAGGGRGLAVDDGGAPSSFIESQAVAGSKRSFYEGQNKRSEVLVRRESVAHGKGDINHGDGLTSKNMKGTTSRNAASGKMKPRQDASLHSLGETASKKTAANHGKKSDKKWVAPPPWGAAANPNSYAATTTGSYSANPYATTYNTPVYGAPPPPGMAAPLVDPYTGQVIGGGSAPGAPVVAAPAVMPPMYNGAPVAGGSYPGGTVTDANGNVVNGPSGYGSGYGDTSNTYTTTDTYSTGGCGGCGFAGFLIFLCLVGGLCYFCSTYAEALEYGTAFYHGGRGRGGSPGSRRRGRRRGGGGSGSSGSSSEEDRSSKKKKKKKRRSRDDSSSDEDERRRGGSAARPAASASSAQPPAGAAPAPADPASPAALGDGQVAAA